MPPLSSVSYQVREAAPEIEALDKQQRATWRQILIRSVIVPMLTTIVAVRVLVWFGWWAL